MDIHIFHQIKDIVLEKLENQLDGQNIYEVSFKLIKTINKFIEDNQIAIDFEGYNMMSEMVTKLFEDRNFQIKIDSQDFKTPLRFIVKEEINIHIEKWKLEKENKDYKIDLDDLDDVEFLLKQYDLVDEKIVIYELLADIYYNQMQYHKEYEYLLKAWELMNRYPPEKTNYRITIKLANNYLDAKKYKEAIRIYQKALIEIDYIPNNYKLHLYYNYALANRKIKMYSFAIGVLEDLLKCTEREDYNLWANAYTLKGICHYELQDYQQSIIDYNKALQVLSFVGYTNKKELIYHNIAISYISLQDYNTAYKYLDGMIEGLEELEENPIRKASVLNQIASLYNSLDKYKEAEEYYIKSLQLSNELKSKDIILMNIDSLMELSKIYEVKNIINIIDENLEYICEDIKKEGKLEIILKSFTLYLSRNQHEKLQSIINRILELI